MSAITLTQLSSPFTVITLPGDIPWVDEGGKGSDLVGEVVSITVGGVQNVQVGAQLAGRLITLQTLSVGSQQYLGMCTAAERDALVAAAALPGAQFTLQLADGRSFTVMFRRDNTAAVTWTFPDYVIALAYPDMLILTINLRTI